MIGLSRIFRRVAWFGNRHRRTSLGVAAILVLTAPVALQGLRIRTDSASFIGSRDPTSLVYRDAVERFGEANPLVIRILHGDATGEVADRFTDRLADRVRGLPEVSLVEVRPPGFDPSPWSIGMTRAALFNSGPEALEQLTARLETDGIRRQLRKSRKRLLLADPEMRGAVTADILDVNGILLPFRRSRLGSLRVGGERGYFDSPQRESRLLFVHPTGSAEDTEYCMRLLERVQQAVAAVRQSTPGSEGIDCGLTGKFAVVGQSAKVLRNDMLRISGLGVGLVLLVLLVVFRSWRATVICGLPILVSLAPILWMARIFFTPLNFLAVGFLAIVVGLGVDAMLHCTARLYQKLADGEGSVEEAVGATLADCGPPVLIGTMTTAAAFLCLMVSDYRGLAEFGQLTAAALAVGFCCSILVFPGVVRLVRPKKRGVGTTSESRFTAGRLMTSGWRHPALALIIGAALIALAIPIARDFRFDYDFRHQLPDRLAALDLADEVSRDHGASFFLSSELLIDAPTLDRGMRLQERVDRELMRLIADGRVAGFWPPTLYRAAPPSSSRHELLRARAAALLKANADAFQALLAELNFAETETYRVYWGHLAAAVAAEEEFARETLPGLVSDPRHRRFFSRDEGGYRFRTLVWLPSASAEAGAADLLSDLFAESSIESAAHLQLTGTQQLFEHLNRLVGSNLVRIGGVSLAAMALLLWLFFRSLRDVLLGLLPVVAAIPVVLALVVLTGIPVPPLGVGVMAIVLGIGIDDAVHLLVRPRIGEEGDMRGTLIEIGPIISLTSLTSMLGFGALSLASHQVLSSIGVVVAMGVGACWLFSIGLLSAIYRLLGRFWIPVLLAVGFLGLTATRAEPAVKQEPAAGGILDKIEENYSSAEAVACRFEQVRRLPELTGEIELHGELTFKMPDRLMIRWAGDENLTLLVDGQTVSLVDHDLEEVEVFDFEEIGGIDRLSGLVPPFLLVPEGELRQRYRIREFPREGGRIRLEFEAREPAADTAGAFVMEVDRRGRVRKIDVSGRGGESSSTTFRRWRRLEGVSDDEFRYEPSAADPGPPGSNRP